MLFDNDSIQTAARNNHEYKCHPKNGSKPASIQPALPFISPKPNGLWDGIAYLKFRTFVGGGMTGFLWFTEKVSKLLDYIAVTALTFIMLLTVTDVFLRRFFDAPIVGTYEIVGMAGAIVLGFSLPFTALIRGLIYVDFLVKKLPQSAQDAVNLTTRIIVIVIFLAIAYNMFQYATELLISREVSLTKRIPLYPIAYGLSFSCFVQCLVHAVDIIKIFRGEYE